MLNWHTREQWLMAAFEKLKPIFEEIGSQVPECRVSCGFTSTGTRNGHIGQCWSRRSSEDSVNQIFISPTLFDAVEVLDTLVHEMVHAVDDCQHKHGKEFKKIALKIGLQGPMRSAGAGPALKARIEGIAQAMGPYPHARLKASKPYTVRRARPRAKCPECGFQVPMLKQYLHFGPPLCPQHRTDMQAVGDWDA